MLGELRILDRVAPWRTRWMAVIHVDTGGEAVGILVAILDQCVSGTPPGRGICEQRLGQGERPYWRSVRPIEHDDIGRWLTQLVCRTFHVFARSNSFEDC